MRLHNWHDFSLRATCSRGDRPVDEKEMLKSLLKVSLAALTTAFAVSSHAADKKLVVATDTAFVPF